ncbi:hypothetical protein AVEN_274121-1 [Araneus ventricosus]|uniref:Uncharacterized protein n=1 Tax=Araneus ventricosus TaxID=182803 RepID=A0A4Y2VES9_ARAVE|nr:hypothetical protein AVEN_274121-1 [Araneus ventricosus]
MLASGSKPDFTEYSSCVGPVACEIMCNGSSVFPLVRWGSLEREVPAQVSSSLSHPGSIWRGPSQNIHCVPSKRDFNITKLNSVSFSNTSYELSAHVLISILYAFFTPHCIRL